jgi:flagellin-like protein
MKGISAIIATVLILLITVALAAAGYMFFSTTFSSITQTSGQTISSTTSKFNILYDIESARFANNNLTFTVRNMGQTDINITNVATYVDDAYIQVSPNSGTITVGSMQMFWNTSSVPAITCGKSVLKVTFAGSPSAQTALITC